jgi:hypothetical protein
MQEVEPLPVDVVFVMTPQFQPMWTIAVLNRTFGSWH